MKKILHQWTETKDGRFCCLRCGREQSSTSEEERCGRRPEGELTEKQLEMIRIGRRYWGGELEKFSEEKWGAQLYNYCLKLRKMYRSGYGLFLWGDGSIGKSYAASVVLKEAMRCGFTGILVSPLDYLDSKINKTMFDEERFLYERIETVDFLVIDDIGKEVVKKQSEWAIMNIDNLLRRRLRECKPTLLTTNMSPAKFGQRYGTSIRHLALEALCPIHIDGSNKREQIGEKLKKEILGNP